MLSRLNPFNHSILHIYTSMVFRVYAHVLSAFSCHFKLHRAMMTVSSSYSNRRRITIVNLKSIVIFVPLHEQKVYTTQPKASSLLPPTVVGSCARHSTVAVIVGDYGSLLARFLHEESKLQPRGKQEGVVLQAACGGRHGERS